MTEQITSKDNKLIKETLKISSSAKHRNTNKKFFIEGLRLSLDALKSNINVINFFYTKDAAAKWSDAVESLKRHAENSILISPQIADLLSDTKTPQGIFCVCEMKDSPNLQNLMRCNTIIALENIQDPTNLGTILRTAEAFAIDAIVLSSDCCDIYNTKVLRGSMGAVFRIPFFCFDNLSKIIADLKSENFIVYASVVDRDARFITDVHFNTKNVVVMGNEGNGLTQQTIQACSEKVTIPMRGKAESLNVSAAANIVMWEMMRERM